MSSENLPSTPITAADQLLWEMRDAANGRHSVDLPELASWADQVTCLVTALAEVTRERDEARAFGVKAAAEYNQLLRDGFTKDADVACAFCGMRYPIGTPRHGDGGLTEHIRICPEHPMRALEADIAALRQQLAAAEQRAQEMTSAAFRAGFNRRDYSPGDVTIEEVYQSWLSGMRAYMREYLDSVAAFERPTTARPTPERPEGVD